MNVFVTGGTGFIGSYVVRDLVNKGHKVTVLARNPVKVGGFVGRDSVEILPGTLYDNDVIEKGLAGKDACIHIALGWGDTAIEMLEKDTKPSLFIFETAAKLGVKNLIYTSSTAAIGDIREIMDEKTDTRPIDFYGATKAATEAFLLALACKYDIRCNVVRPGYTFGNPVVEGGYMQPDQRFHQIVNKVKQNEPIHLVKHDGTQFIWAGDLATIYSAIMESNLNRRIFLGLGKDFITWEAIARFAIEYTGSKSEVILEDKGWKEGGCRFEVLEIEKEFGYSFGSLEKIKDHVRYIADSIK